MKDTLDQIVRQGSIAKKELYAHPKFVEKMVDYIVHDFGEGRNALDSSIGAMIVYTQDISQKCFRRNTSY